MFYLSGGKGRLVLGNTCRALPLKQFFYMIVVWGLEVIKRHHFYIWKRLGDSPKRRATLSFSRKTLRLKLCGHS